MKISQLRWHSLAFTLLCVSVAQAQPNSLTQRPDPHDSSAAVPSVRFHSTFEGYRNLRDESVTSWKENNALVERIGGWRVYAREAGGANRPASESANDDASRSAPRPATGAESNPSKPESPVPQTPHHHGGPTTNHGGRK